jgi:hypothetical protein
MSGPIPGSTPESPAVTCLRYYGSLEAAIEALKSPAATCLSHYGSPEDAIAALKAVSGRVALDEPGELTEVASLKAEVARLTKENARLIEENKVLREQASKR